MACQQMAVTRSAVKQIRHPVLGPLACERSAFAVDGRTDLSMAVYNPATPEDAQKIASLSARRRSRLPLFPCISRRRQADMAGEGDAEGALGAVADAARDLGHAAFLFAQQPLGQRHA